MVSQWYKVTSIMIIESKDKNTFTLIQGYMYKHITSYIKLGFEPKFLY